MKKIIFSIVGSAVIGLGALQAQQQTYDTAGTASKSKYQTPRYGEQQVQQQKNRSTDNSWQQETDRMNSDSYANEGMVIIDKSEIPSSMKKKLKADKYAGWENATIYHNTRTGEYVIAPRAYRFDQQGNEMPISASGDRSGNRQSSRQDQRSYDQSSQEQRSSDQSSQDQQRSYEQSSQNQPRSYDQSSQNQQRSYDQSSQDQQRSNDQSSENQPRSYDQSSNTQQQSDNQSQSEQARQNQNEQQPSTGYRSEQDTQTDPSTQNQYRTEDMTEIQAEQVPATLRRTLSEKQYTGWEDKGTLYQDPATSEYVLEMETETSSSPQMYRFDKNGQLKEDQESTSPGNGRQ